MRVPYSFYVVFNPLLNGENQSYKTQAHEFYHRLKGNLSSGDASKAHFYWGKIKMSAHEEDLKYERFKRAHESNQARGAVTHLFISDFHHFWVAKVESVHKEIFDKQNTLAFYDDKEVEIWFKVSDMDLVSSEYVETGYYLEQLYARNEFCDQEVDSINPYLGGLRYPLIVQDRLAEPYFSNEAVWRKPRALRQNPLIECPGEFGKIASNVQAYVLPPVIYAKLSEEVKEKLIAVETAVYRKDCAPEQLYRKIAESYRDILETCLNDTFARFVREEGYGEVFSSSGKVSLAEMLSLLENPAQVEATNLDFLFQSKQSFYKFCRQKLLDAAHSEGFSEQSDCSDQRQAMRMRNMVLGVGCKGILNSLICLYYEEDFMDTYFRKAA